MKRTDDYDWAEDAIASYALAIQTLRERYIKNRLPGESAKEWLERASVTDIMDNIGTIKRAKGLEAISKLPLSPCFYW